jgi:antitoxin (DNA-binding transcriptional repressor) of toxin-antitoxin stability system
MKTITIDLDQFRNRLDQALAEVEQGELILTRQGKPWIVMRSVSHDRDTQIQSEEAVPSESATCTQGAEDTLSIVDKKVSWVRKYLGHVFETPLEATAFVDGKRVSEDFVLKQGQILEFSDEEEEAGRTSELYESPEFWEMIRERRREKAIPWEEAMRRLDIE